MPADISSGTSRFDVLRDRDFCRFFIGNAVSRIGDSPIPVAFTVATYQIAGQASGIAAVLLSLWGARLVMVGPGGSLADRFNRVSMMLIADMIRLLAQGGLAILVFSMARPAIWHLCLAAAVYGVGSALYVPAQIGFTPQLVKTENLARANALFGVVADVSFVLGPALAGVLMTIGFGWVLVIDCLSFLGNIVCIVGLQHRAVPAEPEHFDQDEKVDYGFLAGLRLTGKYPWFTAGLFFWFFVALGIGLVSVSGPAIALRELGGIGAWATLSTCLAIGSLLGSLSVIVAARALNWRRCAVITATGLLPQYLLLFASKSPSTLWLLASGFLLAGLVTAAGGIIWDAEYQSQLPEQYLSRLGSLENFVNTAAVPVGMLLGGLTEGHDRVIFVALGAVVLVFSLVCSRMATRCRVAPQGYGPVAHRSEERVRNGAGRRDGVCACDDQEGAD